MVTGFYYDETQHQIRSAKRQLMKIMQMLIDKSVSMRMAIG